MNNKWLLVTATPLIIALSGCIADPYKTETDFTAGDSLTIHKAMTIQPGQTRAYIQYGKATTQTQFERYDQHCRFEVKTLSDTPVTIQPGKITISHISFGEEMVAQASNTQLYAFNQRHTAYPMTQTDFIQPDTLLALGGSDIPETFEIIHFTLYSMAQPNLLRLTCASAISDGNSTDEPRNQRPNFKDIQNILGNTASIQPLYKKGYSQ